MVNLVGRLGLADILVGIDDEDNGLTGDAVEMSGSQSGGRDLLVGGSGAFLFNVLTGDGDLMFDTSRGGNDWLVGGGDGTQSFLHGDAQEMFDEAQGGNDRIFGGDGALSNFLVGDGVFMQDAARGGRDLLVGGDHAENSLYGDGMEISDSARTGRDTLVGGDHADNIMRGDGQEVDSARRLAADVLVGGRDAVNDLAGDANLLSRGRGGNDLVRGGEHGDNTLQGDARYLFSRGGDDTVIASHSGQNVLYGDAYQMLGTAQGGDDRLISDFGDDQMWGDAKFRSGIFLGEATEDEWYADPPLVDMTLSGSDSFVFRPVNGHDTIHDFQAGLDVIEMRGFGPYLDEFDDLSIVQDGANCVIVLGCGSITVIGMDGLSEGDVQFV
ncbi:hypothetical protein [Paracoccus benzoatiresistens]|uniref:Hemolysin type calcium-binding protein n=1 Tax=Paracoccus benzoatiresistens TaxID=2997341 RepID=A0ABT4JAL7_9RHOB|nr:hypothetical protein [Paracoccus sp. EF6]MCZ0964170.1 hypothetical protein [Paracoccus sp. EF6]